MIKKYKQDAGVTGLGTLIDSIHAVKAAELIKRGWKRLDYKVGGQPMWLAPGDRYVKEDVAFDELQKMKEAENGDA